MTDAEYLYALFELHMLSRQRRNTRLIIRHMELCGRIHAYEAAQGRAAA